jgi:hypothetical protein
MIVNLARSSGDGVMLERVEGDVMFEGGEPHEGVLATFSIDGREVTGRIIGVSHSVPDDVSSELTVTVEPVDLMQEDSEAVEALDSLAPGTTAER